MHHWKEAGRRGAAVLIRKNPTAAHRRALTSRARDAFWAGWLNRVDPHGEVDDAERAALARAARRLYYAELGRRRGRTRKRAPQTIALVEQAGQPGEIS